MSLRGRLLIALLALVTLGLVISDVATYKTLQRFLVRRVDQQLDGVRRAAELSLARSGLRLQGNGAGNGAGRVAAAGQAGPPGPTFGTGVRGEVYVEVRNAAGKVLATSGSRSLDTTIPRIPRTLPPVRPPSIPPAASSQLGAIRTGPAAYLTVGSAGSGGPRWRLRISALPANRGTLILALPMRDVSATLHDLLRIEMAVSGAVLLAAAGLGLWLVRIGLRPLDDIETTAEAIAAGDLARRVPEAPAGTEVGRLSRSLNAMLTQIEQAFDERQASEDRLRRFVADASHELRTPLTSIRGYSELFRRGANHRPEDLATVMRRIEEEAARMGILVDDLLLLARLDQGRPLARTPLDLTRVAGEAIESSEVIDDGHPLMLQADGPVTVVGDPLRVRQVLDNLLANVRTHTPPGTTATVRVAARNGTAVLEVSDTGPGLEREQAARVFERFYRADLSRTRERGGSGLGLAIVDSIARGLGGRAAVHSAPGEGATFRVELPLDGRSDPHHPVTVAAARTTN
jgi:two-component system OmpR family sensor kinase